MGRKRSWPNELLNEGTGATRDGLLAFGRAVPEENRNELVYSASFRVASFNRKPR
jgi:hypothetical protein